MNDVDKKENIHDDEIPEGGPDNKNASGEMLRRQEQELTDHARQEEVVGNNGKNL